MKERHRRGGAAVVPVAIGAAGAALLGSAELARRMLRRSRLFKPESQPLLDWDPASHGLDPLLVDRLQIRSGSLLLDGWYCHARQPIGAILHCHGNRGNITWVAGAVARLNEAGFDVMTFDYRGFGRSPGRPSVSGVLRDAAAAAALFREISNPALPRLLWGHSLGGAIAAQIAVEAEWAALVLQSTFTSLYEIARFHFAGTLFPCLAGKLLDTRTVISNLDLPIAIIHGEKDETVPYEMAEALHSACPQSFLTRIEGAAHSDLHQVDPASIRDVLKRLLDACASRSVLSPVG